MFTFCHLKNLTKPYFTRGCGCCGVNRVTLSFLWYLAVLLMKISRTLASERQTGEWWCVNYGTLNLFSLLLVLCNHSLWLSKIEFNFWVKNKYFWFLQFDKLEFTYHLYLFLPLFSQTEPKHKKVEPKHKYNAPIPLSLIKLIIAQM